MKGSYSEMLRLPVGTRVKSLETGIIYERIPYRMSDGADAFVEVRNGFIMRRRTGLMGSLEKNWEVVA